MSFIYNKESLLVGRHKFPHIFLKERRLFMQMDDFEKSLSKPLDKSIGGVIISLSNKDIRR